MITPNEAAAMMNVSSRVVYRWIEDAKLHFSEEPGQSLFICCESIARLSQQAVVEIETRSSKVIDVGEQT